MPQGRRNDAAETGLGSRTLGRVGAQSKPESIGATLRDPRREICLLRVKSERPEPASPAFCPNSSPGPTLCTCPSLAFSTSLGSRLLFSNWSWRP